MSQVKSITLYKRDYRPSWMSFAKLIYILIFNTIQHNAFDPYQVILSVSLLSN